MLTLKTQLKTAAVVPLSYKQEDMDVTIPGILLDSG